MEAKFVAYFEATVHGLWLQNFISGLGIVDSIVRPLKIYCDNSTIFFFFKILKFKFVYYFFKYQTSKFEILSSKHNFLINFSIYYHKIGNHFSTTIVKKKLYYFQNPLVYLFIFGELM